MIIKKRRLLILLLFAMTLCFAFSAAVIFGVRANSNEGFTLTNGELKETYMVGDKIKIPDGAFRVDGEEITASFVVLCPDGQGYSEKDFEISSSGKYEVCYQAVHEGKVLQEVYTFEAYTALYNVSSKSSVQFGKASDFTPYEAKGQSGAFLSLASSDTLYYSKTIDMVGRTAQDELISFSVLPATAGVADANKIYVRLTDVVNPENYVDIRIKKVGTGIAWKEMWSYVDTYSNGQMPMGLEANNGTFIYEGVGYSLHKNNDTGTGIRFSMSGMPNYDTVGVDASKVGTETVTLSFDYAKKRVYANGGLVLDLDDPAFQATMWEGFAFDKCTLSLWGDGYNSSSLNLLITSLDGEIDFEENIFVDEEKPVIIVSAEEMLKVSNAVVGKPFAIPSAMAYDTTDGYVDVRVDVYNGYKTDLQRNVTIENNTFLPDRSKIYTIVYTATDRNGNVAEKMYHIDAVATNDIPEITYDSASTACNVGEEVAIGYPVVHGNYGSWFVSISAQVGDTVYDVATVRSDDEPTPIFFRPMQSGVCTVRYEYTDYIYQLDAEYTVDVSAEGASLIIDEPTVPKYIVRGMEYKVPKLYGYTFVDGKAVQKAAELYITNTSNYSSATAYTGDFFTISSGGKVYLTYKLENATKQCIVPVIDVGIGGDFNIAKYFTGYENFSVSDMATEYLVKNDAGVYELNFVNALQVFDFNLSFLIKAANASYSGMEIILEDEANPSKKIVSRYDFSNSSFNFSVNGGRVYSIAESHTDAEMTFSYNALENTISPCSGYSFDMGVINGQPSAAFDSMKAYLTIRLLGVTAANKANITINKINNQFINNATLDRTRPESVSSALKGDFSINSVVELKPFYYADVLNAYCEATIKVTAPNGSVVSSVDGIQLDGAIDLTRSYEIKLEQRGYYVVSYVVKHPNNRDLTYEYMISSKDLTPPVITLGDHAATVGLNETVTVASVSVNGSAPTEDCIIRIVVLRPDGLMDLVGKDGTFIAAETGEYTVYYTVYDSNGNVEFAQYTMIVR